MAKSPSGRASLKQLRNYRLARFWTLKELAEKSGISEPTLVRLEHGGSLANLKTIRALGAALEVDPMVLAFGTPPDIPDEWKVQ
jgi:transcriptional regulator with XRE-family HTH domain